MEDPQDAQLICPQWYFSGCLAITKVQPCQLNRLFEDVPNIFGVERFILFFSDAEDWILIQEKLAVFIEKFCFFILILSFESKPVSRCQSAAGLFLILCGCPPKGCYFYNSERPSYQQYLWFLAGKRPHRIRSSSGSLLTKCVSALEFP